MSQNDDDDRPMDPAESLRLIQRERAAAERNLTPDSRMFLWPWGIAWLIGFTLFFLRYGPGGRIFVNLPDWLPLVALLSLTLAAGVVTGVTGARASRHISGPSTTQGAMYGISWGVAFSGLAVVLGRVSDYLPEAQVNLLWAGAMVALTGALHMAGGAVFKDKYLFGLGAYISAINIVGVAIGPGWHSLVIALFGGIGMLIAGALGVAALRRQTAAV